MMSAKVRLFLTLSAVLAGGVVLPGGAPVVAFAAESAVPVKAPTPPAIRVVAAEKRELIEILSVTGTIVAREEAAAGTDLNGLAVVTLNVDQGDVVRKGDVLAVLDRSSLDVQLAQMDAARAQVEASIAQVSAQIADAEIGVRQAAEALERAKALQQKGVSTQAQLDNAVNAHDSAQAKLVSARKALASSEAQLGVNDAQKRNVMLQIEKTEVKAPADGLVLARNATLGGIVSAAGGPLFRIAIGGEFELAASAAETSLPRLSLDMPATIVLAGAADPIHGKVRRISPEIDQKSRLGALRISLSPDAVVRAGNFARGEIELLRRDGIAVPASALIYRGPDPYLQWVDGGKVKTVAVKVGARAGAYVEILDGISEGQEVVSRAGTFVADGDVVTAVRGEETGAIQP